MFSNIVLRIALEALSTIFIPENGVVLKMDIF